MRVVKVGGSLGKSPELRKIAVSLGACGGEVAVVPGGGSFADGVRYQQPRMGFDDRAAHRMALLAMAQFGHALASLAPSLIPAAGTESVRRVLREAGVPIWLPLDLLGGSPDIPESWDMTSDSLAAWLAHRLGASRLILLKSAAAPATALPDLVACGIVDPLLPKFLAGASFETWLCDASDIPRFRATLAGTGSPGVRVTLA